MKKKFSLFLLVLLIIGSFSGCDVLTLNEDDNSNNSNSTQLTTVVGRIVNSETGEAVSGASLFDMNYGVSGYTDIDGYFQLDIYNSYVYQLTLDITAFGYTQKVEYVYLTGTGFHNCKDIQLNPKLVNTLVSGTVRDSNGVAIPNARVDITHSSGIITVTANSSGYYSRTINHYGAFAIQAYSDPINVSGGIKFFQGENALIETTSSGYTKDFRLSFTFMPTV